MNRWILFVFLFCCGQVCKAQKNTIGLFYFDHIPSSGDTMLTGWKYHPGDDTAWASPIYNDAGWERIEPAMFLSDFMNQHEGHIGWFRLNFAVAAAFRNKIAGISSDASGATEIYLNGKLVRKLGTIDPPKLFVKNRVLTPFPVLLSNDSIQVLAIRFAYKKADLYVPEFEKRITMRTNIGRVDLDLGNFRALAAPWLLNIVSFLSGLNFVLFILFCFVYIYYRRNPQNKYFALFTLYSAVFWISNLILVKEHDQQLRMLEFLVYHSMNSFSGAFYVLTIYAFFSYRSRTVFRWLLLLSGIGTILQFFVEESLAINILNSLPLLYLLEAFRITRNAKKRKEKGASIVLAGISLWLIFFFPAAILVANQHLYIAAIVFAIGASALIILMSIAIAIQVAGTNILLQHKLTEVEMLSLEKQEILSRQNIILEETVATRTAELKTSIKNLKDTQTQLIHAEKMASLGVLSAGIAHEIQNPLNFVNNFSALNVDLISEMNDQVQKGNFDEVKMLSKEISTNEERITYHGKRADAIIKGMLQHSRSSSGIKELTGINALADEYLRLAYHGLRAKDGSFNATMQTDFDPSIGNINIVPQDMGRVILNLVTNAFYAVNEKKKRMDDDYEPTVWVSTKMVHNPTSGGDGRNKIEIRVKDNGKGIPRQVLDKIFEPFFTTKPSGQGTGLGLSMSYDIITKGHAGEIRLVNKEGEGAEFIIILPA